VWLPPLWLGVYSFAVLLAWAASSFLCSEDEWAELFFACEVGHDRGAQDALRQLVRTFGVGLDRARLCKLLFDGTLATLLKYSYLHISDEAVRIDDLGNPKHNFAAPIVPSKFWNDSLFGGSSRGVLFHLLAYASNGQPGWFRDPVRAAVGNPLPAMRCAAPHRAWTKISILFLTYTPGIHSA
jgi:hypothetical protein